jgi:hypothetical protein
LSSSEKSVDATFKRVKRTHLAGWGAKLLHEFVNRHDGSRGGGLDRESELLARAIDFDMTSGVVVLALDSPIGANIGFASVVGSDLTGRKRHPGDDARQGWIVGGYSGAGAGRDGYLSKLETIVSSSAHESSDGSVIILVQGLSVVTDSSGECGFDQGFEWIGKCRGRLDAEGSMSHGSGIE